VPRMASFIAFTVLVERSAKQLPARDKKFWLKRRAKHLLTGLAKCGVTTIYFGFTDDIVTRVTADGAGSRVDIRSHSRQGGGDSGVNAARVRKYLAALLVPS
jgi:hypothetical protein